MLQTRNATVLVSVKGAVNAERQIADMVAMASEKLAGRAASGTVIPRGQILNILA